MTLLSAVLGTSSEASRDANTLALLSYGFANFHLRTPVRAGDRAGAADRQGPPGHARGRRSPPTTFTARLAARPRDSGSGSMSPRQLAGPLKAHAVVGRRSCSRTAA